MGQTNNKNNSENAKDYKGDFVFRIYDANLDFDDIENNLPVTPTKIIRKGEKLRGKHAAPVDVWLYKKCISNWDDKFKTLENMLDELILYSEFIIKAKQKYNSVTLTFYIRTDFAQMGFHIPEEIIGKLNRLNLGLGLDVLSFGMVKDE